MPPSRLVRFSNEVNLGHILVVTGFIAGGLVSWFDLKASDNLQSKDISALQSQVQALTTIAGTQTTQEMRINLLERAIEANATQRNLTDSKLLDSISSLREDVVSIKTRLGMVENKQ